MIYKPHSITIKPETRVVDGGTSFGTAHSLKCQITPMAQGKVIQDYGFEVERPHLLMADKTEANYLQIGYLVSLGTRRFKVKTMAATYDFGNAADHCSCLLEEIDGEPINA